MVTKRTPIKKKLSTIDYLGLTVQPMKNLQKKTNKKITPLNYLGLTDPIIKRSSKRPVKKHTGFHIPGLSGGSGKGSIPGLAGLGGFPARKPAKKSKNIGDYWGEGFVNSVKQGVTDYMGKRESEHIHKKYKEQKQRSPDPELEEKEDVDEFARRKRPQSYRGRKVDDELKPRPTQRPAQSTSKMTAEEQQAAQEELEYQRDLARQQQEAKATAETNEKRRLQKEAAEKKYNDAVRERQEAETKRKSERAIREANEAARRKVVNEYNQQLSLKQHYQSLNPTDQSTFLNKYRQTHPNAWSPEDPLPQAPDITLRDAYTNAAHSTQQWATRQVTPQGIWNNTKSAAKLAAKGAVGAAKLASKGMDKAIEIRKKQLDDAEERRIMREEEWLALEPSERKAILEKQAFEQATKVKLRHMKQQFMDYQMDKDEASLTGQKFQPKVFKISGSDWGEDDKYVDEYGRELPGEPSYMSSRSVKSSDGSTTKKRSTSDQIDMVLGIKQGGYTQPSSTEQSVITPEPRRSMNSAISDLLGVKQRTFRPASQPSFAPEPADEPTALELMGASPRRRVHRGEQPQQQVQVPSSYTSQPINRKKTFHEHESTELNSFKNNEAAVMKQLMGF
jgi:hypothetical protein